MRIAIAVQALAAAIVAVGPAHAQALCPHIKPAPDEVVELKVREKDISLTGALEAVAWLEKDVYEVIDRNQTTEQLRYDTEGFGIPFPNSVMITKGALLKQQALLERERLAVATLKLGAGSGTAAGVARQKRRFAHARRNFCDWLKNARYVD